VVAKYAARVGQSFGTSSSTITVQLYHEIPDVTTAGGRYTFSDGVGNVSSALMRRMIERCALLANQHSSHSYAHEHMRKR
jgi:RNA dependent RNA polymerase